MTEVRLTLPILKVLRLMADQPHQWFGADIKRITNTSNGTLYRMLQHLESAGWLTSKWENIDPREVGRPRRHFYKITAIGKKHISKALNELQL